MRAEERSGKIAVYGNQNRKSHEPEYRKATQLPGKGAETAPARSHCLLQLSCPIQTVPRYLCYLLCMAGEPHPSLFHAHYCPPSFGEALTAFHSHLAPAFQNDLGTRGCEGSQESQHWALRTTENQLLQVLFTNRATRARQQADFSASQSSYWKAASNLTTWRVRNLHLISNLNNS